jgi:gas vesicle protein
MQATDLTRNLPSTEELLRAIGLQRARSHGGEMLGGMALFGAGMLVGVGLALLFAPTSGAEVREQIGSKLEEVRERVAPAIGEHAKGPARTANAS